MSEKIRSRVPAKTPIERMFEKIMHRRMTAQERVYFHLQRQVKPFARPRSNKSSTRAA